MSYLTALKLRLESVFENESPVDLLESHSYTDLLKKLFGNEVAQQYVETNDKDKELDIAKGRPVRKEKLGALSVRDKYLASLANTSQCIAAVDNWDISTRCWITNINLSQYKQIAGKCPSPPNVDCEHMAAFLFQISHANYVQ